MFVSQLECKNCKGWGLVIITRRYLFAGYQEVTDKCAKCGGSGVEDEQ